VVRTISKCMDYYSILGVNKNASDKDIKSAYRKLAMQHHPDKGGDAQKFSKISEAYEILKDPVRRQEYDNPAPQFQFNTSHPFGANPNDIFGSMFRQRQAKNPDITIAADITLEDVLTGKNLIANYKLRRGKTETVSIDVPPGAKNGDTVRYSGLGEDYHNTLPRGDLYVNIRIRRHPIYNRDNDDISKIERVNIFDLLIGAKIDITTIDNSNLKLNVPAGTKPGTVFSVGGYGLPNRRTSKRGNMYVRLEAEMPIINDNEILDKLREIRNETSIQS